MKKPFIIVSSLVLLLIAITSAFFLIQQRTSTQSNAAKTVTLSFSPSSSSSPLTVKPGSEFSLDILLNPGNNLVSTAKININYDAAKVDLGSATPFVINDTAFPQIIDGPTFTPGKISFTVSVGSDPSKAIKTQTKIGTLKFRTLSHATTSEGPTLVEFGSDSVVNSINSTTENILFNTVPATIAISDTGSIDETAPTETTKTTTVVVKKHSIPTIKCLLKLVLKGQLCEPKFATSVQTSSVLKVNYKTAANHCSSIRVHFYVDGTKKYTSGWLGWKDASKSFLHKKQYGSLPLETGTIDLGPVASGTHVLGIQTEGRTSGCNRGKHHSWSGTVDITTSTSVSIPPAPPTSCSVKAPVDAILVMDTSGSMNDRITNKTRKLQMAKTAGTTFVDVLSGDTRNKIGLVSYNNRATVQTPLTETYSTVKTKINSLSANGATCIQCGINKASEQITTTGRPGFKKAVILLTDGRANQVEGGPNRNGNTSVAEQAALTAAVNDYNKNKTVYFTIGLGRDVNASFLRQIANATGGRYYFSPTGNDLNEIYSQISQIVTQGAVSGFVYNDLNNNGTFDAGESKLSERQVQLVSQNNVVQTVTTDEAGSFNVSGVCGGTYTLKQVLKTGWVQTQPTGGAGYTLTITTAEALTNRNFGTSEALPPTPTPTATQPTDVPTAIPTATPTPTAIPTTVPTTPIGGGPTNTPIPTTPPTATTAPTATSVPTLVPTATSTPTGTLVSLDLLLHGIGKIGDNTNPTGFTLSNQNPLNPVQPAYVSVYDASNNLVASVTGNVIFNNTSGSYKGTISLGGSIATGVYTIKVRTDRHLYRLMTGIQSLTAGQTNNLPTTDLVAGDSNNDNKLNILDYNALINCYSDLAPAVACNPTLKAQTDLNDDGNVNQVDYNLFLREIATQPGQ